MQRFALTLAVIMVALATPSPSSATYAGENGRIAFSRWVPGPGTFGGNHEIYSINPDGTDLRQLTSNDKEDDNPSWSEDGRRIAIDRDSTIWTMDANGGNETYLSAAFGLGDGGRQPAWSADGTQLAYSRGGIGAMYSDGTQPTEFTAGYQDEYPAWSPDGSRIAFTRTNYGVGIYILDGTRVTPVIPPSRSEAGLGGVDWSPDGSKLVFEASDGTYSQIYMISPDGTGLVQLTRDSFGHGPPSWSSDGTKIVFTSGLGGTWDLSVMNADGSDEHDIAPGAFGQPSWQPLHPTRSNAGFPRPRGASPFSASLVPSYQECVAPNLSHGPPLSFGSCRPALRSRLTMGTPDANNGYLGFVGRLKLLVIGDSPGPPVTTDVQITVTASDVRCRSDATPCDSPNMDNGPPDYTGELEGRLALRLTDRRNGGDAREPATVEDFALSFGVPCASSLSVSEGGRCSIVTSANAQIPGAIENRDRAIAELGQVEILDGGSDGLAATADDNLVFLTQGVFAP